MEEKIYNTSITQETREEAIKLLETTEAKYKNLLDKVNKHPDKMNNFPHIQSFMKILSDLCNAEKIEKAKQLAHDGSVGEATHISIVANNLIDAMFKFEVLAIHSISSQEIAANTYTIEKESGDGHDIYDQYHTMSELYFNRLIMFDIICKLFPEKSWKSKLHDDGTMFKDYFIVGVNTPEGQFTYHYHIKFWDIFTCKEIPKAPEWDGHQPKDITRLYSLLRIKEGI